MAKAELFYADKIDDSTNATLPLLNMEIYIQERTRLTSAYSWLAKAHIKNIV
jgi:hypothetical protein